MTSRSWPRAWALLRGLLPGRPLLLSLGASLVLLAGTSAAGAQEKAPPPEEIREHLRDILSSGEYDTSNKVQTSRYLWNWILEKIRSFLAGLTGLSESAPVLFWLIIVVLVLILAAIFVHAGSIVVRALRAARSTVPDRTAGRGGPSEKPEALLERAQQAGARRLFTEAVGLCHRAAILGLDRRGLIRYRDSLTLGDYRRQLRRHPGALSVFDDLARVYEPATFGRRSIGVSEFSSCFDSAGALVRERQA